MVWKTFIYPKNKKCDNNLTTTTSSSSSSSLPPSSTLPSSPRSTSTTTTPNLSSPTNHTQHSNNNKSSSNERSSSSPRPPPRLHRPTPRSPSSSSSRSYSHKTDNNTSGYNTLNNDLPFSMTPAGRFFTHFFDEAMQYFNYPMHDIIWSEESPTKNSSINEKIIDNDEKFSIEIDLSDFLAGELLIIYNEEERELLVEGHRKERNGRFGSIERNFKRKFDIPIDVHDGSLAAFLIPSGLLTIQAFKKGNKQPIRRIPIQEIINVPNSTDQNAAKFPTFENMKNTTSKTNINPPMPPKSTSASELKSCTPEKMSKITDKIPTIQKFQQNKEKQLNFNEMGKDSGVKREYLNIFC
ncbi:unnamed protein product [Wuchereria bancrofti]|uniref:SHSP domain-containing protein n=1 Tax=Wuchereria bancrofti TaxID=6293 RepID=A0A3P7E8N2_WUCBA|nr:unnamed protein product [Wuchereria bancrofti]